MLPKFLALHKALAQSKTVMGYMLIQNPASRKGIKDGSMPLVEGSSSSDWIGM